MTNVYSNELSDAELAAVSGGDLTLKQAVTIVAQTAVGVGVALVAGALGGGSTASTGEMHNSDRGVSQEHSRPDIHNPGGM